MCMAIIVLVLSISLPIYGIGRSFKTFGWVPLVTYMPVHTFFCTLPNFSSVGRRCISPTDLGSISLLPFGATRKHLLWSLTRMIHIYANCVHTRRLQSAANAICFCAINAWLITRVTCQMMSRDYMVLFLTLRH